MIDSSSIISSLSDNILIELVTELYERTKQSSTLPLLLAHIGLSDPVMNKMILEFAASTQQLYSQILCIYSFRSPYHVSVLVLKKLDNRLFLIAGREYYLQLMNIEQRLQFEQAFINESNPEKLYADLLAHIQNTILSSSWKYCFWSMLNSSTKSVWVSSMIISIAMAIGTQIVHSNTPQTSGILLLVLHMLCFYEEYR
ncbi:unnamed protein product [Rotaria sp. Silwood1]|nr:unnamed protein product [Rotaria sp. Silwood1]